jgi:hypothetical protein
MEVLQKNTPGRIKKSKKREANNTVIYTLLITNNSNNPGHVCVFQTDPDVNVPNMRSLAWFSKYTHPTTTVKFDWKIEYDFVWSETGILDTEIIFFPCQKWKADLSTKNKITLTYENAFTFKEQTQGTNNNKLYIWNDGTIPPKKASVGIGMYGKSVFAVQAQSNMDVIFTPKSPKYWVSFGNYKQGQVLDIKEMSIVKEIVFPNNIFSMTAILKPDHTWKVMSTPEANAKFLEGKKKNPAFKWGDQFVSTRSVWVR